MATAPSCTSSRRFRATSFDPASFAPFGEVIQNPATHNGEPSTLDSVTANQGSATKWLDVTKLRNWYDLAPSKKAGKAVMNMFVCKPRELHEGRGYEAFDVTILERHPFTPQTFVPLGLGKDEKSTCYLVIVAPTLPVRSKQRKDGKLEPPYPTPPPRRKKSLKERLARARPNPFTNDFHTSTTPTAQSSSDASKPKGPGMPDLDNIKAFVVRGDQAVTYGPGTWHAPMVVLGERPIDFVVVQYANGVSQEDCQEVVIDESKEGRVEILLDEAGEQSRVSRAPRSKL